MKTATSWRDGIAPPTGHENDKSLLRHLIARTDVLCHVPVLIQIGDEVDGTEPTLATRHEARVLLARELEQWYWTCGTQANDLWPLSIAFWAKHESHADLPAKEREYLMKHLEWAHEHSSDLFKGDLLLKLRPHLTRALVYAGDLEYMVVNRFYDAIPIIYGLLVSKLGNRTPSPPESVLFRYYERNPESAPDEGERITRDLVRVNLVCGAPLDRWQRSCKHEGREIRLARTLLDMVASSARHYHLLDDAIKPNAAASTA